MLCESAAFFLLVSNGIFIVLLITQLFNHHSTGLPAPTTRWSSRFRFWAGEGTHM